MEITVVSLHSELRTIRDGICKSCQRKFVPANLAATPSVSSLVKSPQGPAKHTNPMFSWRRLLKAHASDHIPSSFGPSKSEIPKGSKDISLSILPIPFTPSTAITQKPVPRWFAERDPTANPALYVTFVREFTQKDPVRSVRFSPDGKHLAAVVTAADYKNGVIFIYNVETGDKTW